jgi:hypothetical protein
MHLRDFWSRRWNRWFTIGAVAVMGLALVACAFLQISSPRDVEAYVGMSRECHPVWRQLAFRRYTAGDSVAELFRRFPPSDRKEFGRYGLYSYHQSPIGIPFAALSVVTRDGKLLSAGAGSCTWRFCFFQTEDAELDQQYAVFIKERHERLERQRLGRLETELRKFYSRHSRWPTNELEFSLFVSPEIPSYSTNDLGIILVQRSDGSADIALIELPTEKRSVLKPAN